MVIIVKTECSKSRFFKFENFDYHHRVINGTESSKVKSRHNFYQCIKPYRFYPELLRTREVFKFSAADIQMFDNPAMATIHYTVLC